MKLIYTILLLICFKANATVFYVSAAGNDANNGTTELLSWRTIAHVNAQTFAQGDYILFKCGDSWNERLNPPSSGIAGSVITFGSYGAGLKPIITGFQSLTGFINTSGNIWSATATNSVNRLNLLEISGNIISKGRYPNSGFLNSYPNTFTQLTLYDTGVPYNYSDGEVVVKNYQWVLDVQKIISQSGIAAGSTINLEDSLTYNPNSLYYFFFQNSIKTLDIQNEWAYNDTSKLLSIYSTSIPLNIRYSTIDTLVYLHGKNYITFDGIAFTGANKTAISIDSLTHVIIQNCSFSNIGKNGIEANKAESCSILNDSLINCQNNALFTAQFCDTLSFKNNVLKNCGIKQGMGSNGNNSYCGAFIASAFAKINYNTVDSCGLNGISFLGHHDTLYRNYVTNFTLSKKDGGGIYTYGAISQVNSLIRSNIVIYRTGAYSYEQASPGIYLDNYSFYIRVDSNTCNSFLLMNQDRYITVRDNIFTDSLNSSITATSGYAYDGINVSKNIFLQKGKSFPTIDISYIGATSTSQDSNYIFRIDSIQNQFRNLPTLLSYSLGGWQSLSGFDTHSIISTPLGALYAGNILLYNPTLSDSTFILPGSFITLTNTFYKNTVTIPPFQSKLLFPFLYSINKRIKNLNFK